MSENNFKDTTVGVNLPDIQHRLAQKEELVKFLEYIKVFEQYVSNPNTNMNMIFGMENQIRLQCKKYSIDFDKLHSDIMKNKELDYTQYVENWFKIDDTLL